MEISEEIIFQLITNAGAAKSDIFEAFRCCQIGKYGEAEQLIESAGKCLLEAHKAQTNLIQQEAAGESAVVGLLMVHAQDHLMTCILAKDIVTNMIAMQKEINDLKNKVNS